MNREIKFRVWSTFHNKEELIYLNEFTSKDLESCDNWKVMQYTGLKDKNGREIYEGDLIHWVIYDNGYDGKNFNVNKNKIIKEGIGKVYWASDHYKIKGCKKSISSLIFSASKEVVGNIYAENKKLKQTLSNIKEGK